MVNFGSPKNSGDETLGHQTKETGPNKLLAGRPEGACELQQLFDLMVISQHNSDFFVSMGTE